MVLATTGLTKEEVLEKLESYRSGDVRWRDGRAFAIAYDAGRQAEEVGREAYARFAYDNALDPTVVPSARRLETDLVGTLAAHLGGGPETAGSFTSGGTESIMLAVKVAREVACAKRPGLARPHVLMPTTAHAAFVKAAHYLGLGVVTIDVDRATLKADVEAMRRAVTEETVLLVGSAPCWPYGVIDPIAELSEVAGEKGLLFHVDACVGGFLLPFFRRLGASVPDFDFRLPGVTSISVDLHKFAFAPKGASMILHRSSALRRHQIFAWTDWPGYTIVNPTVQSSKSAGPLAGAWAVVQFLGDEGYLEMARRILAGSRDLAAGIAAIPGLALMGRPEFALLAVAAHDASVFRLADELKERGWEVQVQLGFRDLPPSLHFLVTPVNAARVVEFLGDLRAVHEAARGQPAGALRGTVGEVLASLGAGGGGPEVLRGLMAQAGIRGTRLPRRRAEINELLDALPRALCRELVIEYFSELYTPGGEG